MTTIYVAYRTGYTANLRKLVSFEADSILDWFQTHWQSFCTDDYEALLGFYIYGLPFCDTKDSIIPPPQNMEALTACISRFAYCNEVQADDHCIQVLTDDDEIELAWYVFDETYKQNNMHKLALWFTPELPTDAVASHTLSAPRFGHDLPAIPTVVFSDDTSKTSYLIASPIYDSANLEDTCAVRLQGVHLPELLHHLRVDQQVNLDSDDSCYSATNTLLYLQKIANTIDDNRWAAVVAVFNTYPATEINIDTFDDMSPEALRNEPNKSVMMLSEHMVELGINSMGEFYNYYVLFDDVWAQQHPQLATSLVHFGMGWEI